MGTGAISTLFHVFPYGTDSKTLQAIALAFLILNTVLFTLFTCIGTCRYLLFRNVWSTMLRHPVQSLYLGTFPMGFATMIVAAVTVVYEYFNFGGHPFLYSLWGFWWLDVAISFVICFGQLLIMATRHKHSIEAMTTVWLLPVVTLIVASSTGGVLAGALQAVSPSHALLTLAVSVFMVVIGVTVAFMMLTIYLYRLIIHGLPEGVSIFSAFLPLGPMGQAGYSILLIGHVSRTLFLATKTPFLSDPLTPQIIDVFCLIVSFTLWSLATAWLILAVLSIGETLRKGALPFKLTFWGMIFPNGVYANLTIQLAGNFDSKFLRIWGAIYACFTLGIWTFAMYRTIPMAWSGEIFQSPCVEEAELRGTMQFVKVPSSNGQRIAA